MIGAGTNEAAPIWANISHVAFIYPFPELRNTSSSAGPTSLRRRGVSSHKRRRWRWRCVGVGVGIGMEWWGTVGVEREWAYGMAVQWGFGC